MVWLYVNSHDEGWMLDRKRLPGRSYVLSQSHVWVHAVFLVCVSFFILCNAFKWFEHWYCFFLFMYILKKSYTVTQLQHFAAPDWFCKPEIWFDWFGSTSGSRKKKEQHKSIHQSKRFVSNRMNLCFASFDMSYDNRMKYTNQNFNNIFLVRWAIHFRHEDNEDVEPFGLMFLQINSKLMGKGV